jgi:hypothetical protein
MNKYFCANKKNTLYITTLKKNIIIFILPFYAGLVYWLMLELDYSLEHKKNLKPTQYSVPKLICHCQGLKKIYTFNFNCNIILKTYT